MPLRWKFDHANKIVEIVLEGETKDVEAVTRFLDLVEAEGAVPYGKLIDATKALVKIDNNVMAAIARRIATFVDPGPLAILLPQGGPLEGHAKLFMMAVDVESRARIFRTETEARQWLLARMQAKQDSAAS
jgi:hypothetical protein